MSNMKIENQIKMFPKEMDNYSAFRLLVKYNNFKKNRKKSIALIKHFGWMGTYVEGMTTYTSDMSLYFHLLKTIHKITEEELKCSASGKN